MAGRLVQRTRTAMSSAAFAVLFLLLLAPFPHSASGQGCLYQYLRQPPSSLQPVCNPYAGIATLRVQCQASVPSSEAAAVKIQWFYNNQLITDSFPAAIELSPLEEAMGRSNITSTLVFDGDFFNDTFQGNYYCQIVVMDGNNSTAPSNTLMLESADAYIFSDPCLRIDYFSDDITCVGNKSLLPPTMITTVDRETSTDALATTTATSTVVSATPTALPDNSPPLQVWVYVLVAIAAVFGMIIVVLTILCVGLCLKKNKTEDTYKQKEAEIQQFTSNSMVSNGLYQRKDEGGVTSGTHISSHSQISDYNTLNERDYEVIDMGEDKHDYHRLQRPSPPTLPGGRNFSFTPPKEFHSMSTLISQVGGVAAASSDAFQHGKMSKNGSFLTTVVSEEHVYRELEQTMPPSADTRLGPPVKDIYRSPTESDSPDSAQLFNRGTFPSVPVDAVVFEYPNESLYTPNFESSLSGRLQQGGLENVPETGSMFCEPVNPTAFPVHKYEKVHGESPQYETPVPSRVKNVTSPSTLASVQGGEVRPRTNSGARYETELPPTRTEDSQYSKLIRPNEVLAKGPPELSREHGVEEGVFSRSTAELSKQDMAAKRFSGKSDRGFTMPIHVGSSGGGVVNRTSSVSSTDSLALYIAQLQAIDGDKPTTDLDGLLFNEQATHREETQQQHDGCKRNGSFGTGIRKGGYQQQKRAWSEERREAFPNGMNDRSGFSGSAIDSHSLSSHERPTAAPKMHREMRVNGIDFSIGDYARSKTMV